MGLSLSSIRNPISSAYNATKDAVTETVDTVVDAGEEALDTATSQATEVYEGVSSFVESPPSLPVLLDPFAKARDRIVETAEQGIDFAQDVGRRVIDAVEDQVDFLAIEKQLDDLGPGDSYQLRASIDGSVYGIGGRLEGTQTITKNDDGTFTLAVAGEAGAGLMGSLQQKGSEVTGGAFSNTGGTVEFTFDSAEEAADAARTFLGPVAGGVSGLLDGGIEGALDGATPDYGALLDNVSALELNPNSSTEIAASLSGGKQASLGGGVNQEYGAKVRLEFGDGAPKLVLSQYTNISAEVAGGIPGLKGELGGDVKLQVQESFELPDDLSVSDVMSNPGGLVKDLASTAVNTGEVSVSLTANVKAQGNVPIAGTLGGQAEARLAFTGGVDEVFGSGGIESLLQGRFGKAFNQFAGVTQLEASLTPYETDVTEFSQGFGRGLASIGGGFSATTTDRKDPTFEYSGSVADVRDQLRDQVNRFRFQARYA
ncbi:hypothetical protein SAMN05443572_111240 [Myxococcus fulvus]|uniref:Uncharacterized protein n=1 Tax=Myxococcus fulvus TaxID=33 RepID=A0A511TD36_MYXFU|nr:hypothetical protein [Myxococcus fulvus]GEN12094.1 hypothetical protein MFU01_71310 [Myxococcus fulvus]SEU36611.1 hypothetical protein SAMN05443572_111240 [Myxococcus fulvus]